MTPQCDGRETQQERERWESSQDVEDQMEGRVVQRDDSVEEWRESETTLREHGQGDRDRNVIRVSHVQKRGETI